MTTTNTAIYTVVDHTELSHEEIAFAERFGSKVIGQPGALRVAQLAYNMAKNPLRDRTRPIGIFFLAGPSRTGKSHTGATIAEILHGDPEALTRIQASDYTEDHQLLELKGAPPSYVGFRDPKDPKNKLEDHETDPYSVVSPHNLRRVRLNSGETVDVVVIEEFEKSSPDFYKFWMGVFDKGVARLGNGMVADFRNTIFILTSNIGMDRFEREQRPSMGFVQSTRESKVDDVVMEEIKRAYKPEFRNRLDAIVVFQPFTSDTLVKIVDSEFSAVRKRISEEMEAGKDFTIEVTDDAKQFMLREVNNNVAELKRVINRDVLMPLGRLLVTGKVNGGDIVRISVNAEGTALEFSVAKNALGVGENERIIVKRGKGGGVVNLSLQRDLRKAALAAKNGGGIQEFSVISRGDNSEKMMKLAFDVIHTLENVIEVEVTHVSYQRVAPFVFQLIVKGTREQMNLLCRIHEADDLAVNPTATKALPAPKE